MFSRRDEDMVVRGDDASRATGSRSSTPAPFALPGSSAPGSAGRMLRDIAAWSALPAARRPSPFRLLSAMVAALLGCILLLGAARADEYLHRGIESGNEFPPVRHLSGRELGVNADLREFAPDELDELAANLKRQGVRYVRQPFAWSAIEVDPGTFDWSAYDPIINSLGANGIAIVAVIVRAPSWASGVADPGVDDAPPTDRATLGAFIDAVTERYNGELAYLQLWDQPNTRTNWGGQLPDAQMYADMLATTASAARQRDPEIRLLTAELSQGPASDGVDDLTYLKALYSAGAASSFDAVAISLPGATSSPFDRWVDADRLTMSRAVLVREIMRDAGDGETPIWATSFPLGAELAGGSSALSAAFALGGLERARSEWPWQGPIFLGTMIRNPESASGTSLVSAMGLDPAYQPILDTAEQFATVSAPGLVPSGAAALAYEGDWSEQMVGPSTLRSTTEQGASVTVRFQGTAVSAILRQSPTAGSIRVSLDGRPLPGTQATGDATVLPLFRYAAVDATIPLASRLIDADHELTIELAPADSQDVDQAELSFGGIIVARSRPSDWPITVLAAVGIVTIWYGMRESIYVLAIWAGWLRRHRELDLGPPLGAWDSRPSA